MVDGRRTETAVVRRGCVALPAVAAASSRAALIDCAPMVNLITADWSAGRPFISTKNSLLSGVLPGRHAASR